MKKEKEVAFFVRKSDEALYRACLESLQALHLPVGYEAELFTLTAEKPYAAQANKALTLSDAKYKIYINDDVRLVRSQSIEELLTVFEDVSIGMVGVLGSQSLPRDGNVLGSDYKRGVVYVPTGRDLSEMRFGEVSEEETADVRFLLPSFYATQMDLPWDEEYETQYYALLAQCRSFEEIGSRIVTSLAKEAWCAYQSRDISFDAEEADHAKFFARYHPYLNLAETEGAQAVLYACGEGTTLPSWRDFSHPEGIVVGRDTHVHRTASCGLALSNFAGRPKLLLGDHCTIGAGSTITALYGIRLENNVTVAENVHIKDYAYDETAIGLSLEAQTDSVGGDGIQIESGVRIEEGVRIEGAVQIGRGSFIRAGSTVCGNIPAYCIAAGSPARVVKAFSLKERKWLPLANEQVLARLLAERKVAAPLLTFAIITYNRCEYLRKSLDCVLRQLGNDDLAEILVSDNASTDDTKDFVEEMQKTYRNLRYHRNEMNVGAEANIHVAIGKSRGEYVLVAGDDDYFTDGSLLAVLGRLLQHRGRAIFHLRRAHEPYRVHTGSGIAEYVHMVGYHMTWITSTIMRRDIYARIKEPKKHDATRIPQVYLQMEMLKQEPDFAVIAAPFMRLGSGEHTTTGFNLVEVFIKNYFDLLKTAGEIPSTVLSEEKKRLMEECIYFQCERIKAQHLQLSLDGLFDVVRDYYGEEPYYEEICKSLEDVLKERQS